MWTPGPRLRKVGRWAGYPLFYLLCLVIFFYVTFPFTRLKQRIVTEFNAAQAKASGMRLEIDELSWYWITGIEAEGVRLISPPPPAPDGKLAKPEVYEIQHAHVRMSFWSALIGNRHVSFGIEAGGGEVSGSVADDGPDRTVSLSFQGLGVSGLPFVAGAVGLPMTGSLTGTVELALPEQKLSKGNGTVELAISELAVGDGKAKIRDTIALPRLEAGKLELSAKVKDGNVKVDKFTAQGPDLELGSDGRIRLRDPFGTSRAELTLRFKFSDRYKAKSDITKRLFGEPGSNVPGAFDLDPKIRAAKEPDGFYGWRVYGPLARLDFQPAPHAAGAAVGKAPRHSTPKGARPLPVKP
jgi:type II secretion system protein N